MDGVDTVALYDAGSSYMTSAVAPASGKGDANQLTLSFQGEVYVFDSVYPKKVCCVSRFDSANVNANVGMSVNANTSASSSGLNARASKVVSQKPDNKKNSGVANGITTMNGHPTLDLVPVKEAKSPWLGKNTYMYKIK
ncbi:Arogenate dehydratase [Abeliophyllum distichum]|uniref:Arogenate dehydratase n=1 Tax=Abeliophyllum distichum TaxID=126358 RepID=A0ABD1SUR2_9LAMI